MTALQQLEAGHGGHLDVGEDDVGVDLANLLERLLAVGGGGDDIDVVFEIEESRQGAQHQALILGDDDSNHLLGSGGLGIGRQKRGSGLWHDDSLSGLSQWQRHRDGGTAGAFHIEGPAQGGNALAHAGES